MSWQIAFQVVGTAVIGTAVVVGLIVGLMALLGPLGGALALTIVVLALFFAVAAGL